MDESTYYIKIEEANEGGNNTKLMSLISELTTTHPQYDKDFINLYFGHYFLREDLIDIARLFWKKIDLDSNYASDALFQLAQISYQKEEALNYYHQACIFGNEDAGLMLCEYYHEIGDYDTMRYYTKYCCGMPEVAYYDARYYQMTGDREKMFDVITLGIEYGEMSCIKLLHDILCC